MIKLVQQGEDISYGVRQYCIDTEQDLEKLPDCDMGSTVFVISTSSVYMRNGEDKWVKI